MIIFEKVFIKNRTNVSVIDFYGTTQLSKPVLTLAFIESQNSHKAYRETILTTLQKITKENLGMGAGKNKTKGNDRKRKGKKDKKEEGGQKPDGDKKDDENTNGTTLEEFTSATPLPILLTSGSTGTPEKNTNVYRKLKQKAIDKLQERVDDLKKQIDYLHKLELQLYKVRHCIYNKRIFVELKITFRLT